MRNTKKISLNKNISKASAMLKAISHPERLIVLCHLSEGEKCAGDLWERSELSQSAFSQHLAILRKEKLVQTRRKAQTIYYSLAEPVKEVLRVLCKLYK